jgi:hypothetical protein
MEESEAAPGEPASGDKSLQQFQPVPEPASDEPGGEAATDMTETPAGSEPLPVGAGDDSLSAPQPGSDVQETAPVPESTPASPEESSLPAVEPVTMEEPATPADPAEEPGRVAEEITESPLEELQEPGDEQPRETTEQAPADSTGEAEEIPTAGSPELQRVLENIDRTFNN